jgi:hypothetical protein
MYLPYFRQNNSLILKLSNGQRKTKLLTFQHNALCLFFSLILKLE